MNKIKILFLSQYYSPHLGGVEKHLAKISQELIKKNYQITILTSKHDSSLKEQSLINGVKIVRIDYPKIKFIGLFSIWWQLLIKHFTLFNQADIIHLHDVFIWYLPLTFFLAKKKVFITFHGWEGQYPIPLKNILYKKLAAIFTKKNLCIGQYIEKYYGIKAHQISYGAVEIDTTINQLSVNAEDKTANKANKNPQTIVFVGRLEADTGLLVFLDFLKKLPQFKVDFCGDGPLAVHCTQYGTVHGFCDPQPYLKQAQFCFAGGYLAALEAMAKRCLVLTAYQNNLTKDYWQLSPFATHIIAINDAQSLKKEIAQLLQNPKLMQEKLDQAFSWVQQETWTKLARTYIELWQD